MALKFCSRIMFNESAGNEMHCVSEFLEEGSLLTETSEMFNLWQTRRSQLRLLVVGK